MESYWNRCLIDSPPAVELDPGYGRPEHQADVFPLRMMVMLESGEVEAAGRRFHGLPRAAAATVSLPPTGRGTRTPKRPRKASCRVLRET